MNKILLLVKNGLLEEEKAYTFNRVLFPDMADYKNHPNTYTQSQISHASNLLSCVSRF